MANQKRLIFRDDGTILVKEVIASYLHVFEPWAKNAGETKKFSGRFLLPNDTHEAEIKELRIWLKKKQQDEFKGAIKADALFFRDGDQLGKDEYANCWYIAASENIENPPTLLRPDKKECVKKDDLIYSGAIVNIIIRPWYQKNDFGKRVNANLLVVQHKAHGEKFGNASAPVDTDGLDDEEFEGVEDDDDL